MAIVMVEGFDHISITDDTASLRDKWNNTSITNINVNATEIPGPIGNSMLLGVSSAFADWYYDDQSYLGISSVGTGVVGFHFFTTDYTASVGQSIVDIMNGDQTTSQLDLRIDSENGALKIFGGSVELADSLPNTIKSDTWYFIEFKFEINTSIGANSTIVYVDNVAWITLPAGTDTETSGTNASGFKWAGATGSTRRIDDIYVTDNASSLTPSYAQTLFPAADFDVSYVGSDGDSIDNYLNVDDPSHDEDVSFNANPTTATDGRDVYTMDALLGQIGVIHCVDYVSRARKSLSTPAVNWSNMARISGTNYDQTSSTLSISYDFYNRTPLATNPANGQPWNVSDIAGAAFGVFMN